MVQDTEISYDVIVVGGGNAAMCAALAARESGRRVLLIEKASPEDRGGNCPYTGGGFRFTHNGAKDLEPLLADPSTLHRLGEAVGPYTAQDYRADMLSRTAGLTDPDLLRALISRSYDTVLWMAQKGIRFELSGSAQAAALTPGTRVGVSAVGSGPGLINMHYDAARRHGVDVVYRTKMLELIRNPQGAVTGLVVEDPDGVQRLRAGGVVLACGGFEANPQMRGDHLGGHWTRAKVRGSRHNTGDGHRAAMAIGAGAAGQWDGCHGSPIDLHAPDTGSPDSVDRLPRRSYHYGVMLNLMGQRFVDEGSDLPLNNFVIMGDAILQQPEGTAFQVFDAKTQELLEPRYGSAAAVTAGSVPELAQRLGLNPQAVEDTISQFNDSVQEGTFNPAALDGKSTAGLTPPKSNWAQTIDAPPFSAYRVTGAITYTFGGLKINPGAQVLDTHGAPIPGLYAAGEIVGGFFYHDSLRASGLMHGSVFGRIAGANAARP